ncbi:Ku protein [Streptacidiphilus sp. PB12-B1b]|uniref:non-homologous end joining protein Ku n=1 Tax=Streptacidiphilus sp. PB12-B1b TaxID=2705012 RepID=UPI0015FE2D0A|nr:Ku protein [Streptacidiphilus sp. PB12-B1b]QMU77409.1 Ku protein [Streptacidiphilus sp. PB12-B1b]
MARPIWTGALSFGLVTVPVRLYSATEDHTTHFRQIQRGTADRVRMRRVNERTGEEVAFDDIVKGYDLGEEQYVIIEPGELEEIAPGRSRVIEVSAFVDLAEVDPIYFSSTYYLAPRGEEFTQIYSLLLEALEDSQRAAVATFVMRGKEYLTTIRPAGNVLEMHTLHYADEVRDPAVELPELPERTQVDAEQLAAAKQLIDLLSTEWNPAEYRDSFEDRVHELIDAKRAGHEVVTAAEPPGATNVIDLMEALRRSLDRAGGPQPAQPANEDGNGDGGGDGGGTNGSSNGGARAGTARRPKAAPAAADGRAGHAGSGRGRSREKLSDLTKSELYSKAADLDIPGRSSMTREDLIDVLGKVRAPRKRASA